MGSMGLLSCLLCIFALEAVTALPQINAEAIFMHKYYSYRNTTSMRWIDSVKGVLIGDINWVQKGGVTKATSQGRCATCQDFSCIADVEGAWFTSGHALTKFSEQEMVDCGGGDHYGMRWIVSNGGVASIETAPLANHSDPTLKGCRGITDCASIEKENAGYINGSTCLTNHNEENILGMLQHGPMSVSVNAGPFNGYQGLTLSGPRPKPLIILKPSNLYMYRRNHQLHRHRHRSCRDFGCTWY